MSGEPYILCARRSVSGTVALADALGVAVASLAIGPDGLRVDRFVDVGGGDLPPGYASADPKAVAEAVAGVLSQHGFGRRLTCLGIDDSLTGASLADVPEARGRMLAALVGRHVREELPVQTAPVLADLVRLQPDGDEEARRRCWVAWSDQDLVEGLAREFRARDVTLGRVLPPSVALLDMLGRTREVDPDRLELLVRFCWPSVVIGVFAGGRPQYARFLNELLVDAQDPVEAGILELHRTVGFIRERNRGRAPDLIWCTGLDASLSADFFARLETDLGIPAAAIEVESEGDASVSRRDRLVVLAALLHHEADRGRGRAQRLDLLPDPPARDHWMLAGLGAVLVATAAVSMSLFEGAQQGNMDVVAKCNELRAEQVRLTLDSASCVELGEQLSLLEAWSESLAVVPAPDPVQPVAETVLSLPDGISMRGARLDRPYAGAGSLHFDISGDFTGLGAQELSGFLAALESRPWAAQVVAQRGQLTFERSSNTPLEELAVEVTLR